MICPICKNNMVERKSKYGSFMGCSGYPKCKYHCDTELNKKFKQNRAIEKYAQKDKYDSYKRHTLRGNFFY